MNSNKTSRVQAHGLSIANAIKEITISQNLETLVRAKKIAKMSV